MTSDAVRQFINHWHQSVAKPLPTLERRNHVLGLIKSMERQVEDNSAIGELAKTPILCALLCALHRERSENLPSNRKNIYEACVNLFLRRNRYRKIKLADYPDLDESQMLALLKELAWWMLINGQSSTGRKQVEEKFQEGLRALRINSVDKIWHGGDVVDLFVHVVAILREPSLDVVDFPHRTFQEYLASRVAIEGGNAGALVKNAFDGQWREVLLLAFAQMGSKASGDLLLSVLNKIKIKISDRAALKNSYLKLAFEVVSNAVILPESSQEVFKLLISDVKLLNLKETEISTIDLIVSAVSLENLTLASTKITDIRPLQSLLNLKTLRLASTPVKDFTPLANMTSLEALDISRTQVADISWMSSLGKLENLDVSGTLVSDLSPLLRLPKLRVLRCGATPAASNIEMLESLKSSSSGRLGIIVEQ